MRNSLPVLLLIGNVSASKVATEGFLQFIEGNFDDDNEVIVQMREREEHQKDEYRKNLIDMSKQRAND